MGIYRNGGSCDFKVPRSTSHLRLLVYHCLHLSLHMFSFHINGFECYLHATVPYKISIFSLHFQANFSFVMFVHLNFL